MRNDEIQEHFCDKCRMTFEIRVRYSVAAEKTLCSIPGCRTIFWHGSHNKSDPSIKVGIEPLDLQRIEMGRLK